MAAGEDGELHAADLRRHSPSGISSTTAGPTFSARLVNRLRDQSLGAGRDLATVMELADFEKMEQIRARVDDIVEDPATAEALKPWYRQFCKRPCFHDEYLQAFNRPNVTLVDTDGRGVDAITSDGVVVG